MIAGIKELTREEDIRYVSAGDLLLDTGLLFEINRRILNPLGLCMVCTPMEDGTYKLTEYLIDARHIEGGLTLVEPIVERSEKVLFQYMDEYGVGMMQERQRLRGFVTQKSRVKHRSESI